MGSVNRWERNIQDKLTNKRIDGENYITFKNTKVNMYEVLKEKSNRHPNKIALVDSFGKEYNYKDLLRLTEHFSKYLYHQKQIRKGSHVGLVLYNSVEFVVSFLAAQNLRAVIIPLPTKYSNKEIRNLIIHSDCDLVISEKKFVSSISELNIDLMTIDTTNENYSFTSKVTEEIPSNESGMLTDIALIVFTSGTTSGSKGAVIQNYNLQHAISAYEFTLDLRESDSTILSIPIYNVTGLIATMLLFLKIGGTVRIHKFFNPKLILKEIAEYDISFFHGSPTVFLLMLKEKESFMKLPALQKLACGSGNMPSNIIKDFKEWIPQLDFRTIYGLSETSSPATVFPKDASKDKKLGSSGIPIPGLEVKIVDDQMKEVPLTEKGEIIIKGTNVVSSYYKLDTHLISEDGWLKTGDIGYLDNEGFLYIVDRKKDMINRGGEKVYCIDIENVISNIEGIDEVAVVAKKDSLYGEVPIAIVTLKSGYFLTEEDIKTKLFKLIAKFEVPKEIMIEEEVPKTPNGKIDKKYIRKKIEEGIDNFGGEFY